MNTQNKLRGKTIVWCGDTMSYGYKPYGNWASRISAWNAGPYVNYSARGTTVTENVPTSKEDPTLRPSISVTLEKMYASFPDADYIVLQGGGNDAAQLGSLLDGEHPARVGSYDNEDFGGDYDVNTYCGALESIFFRATKYWHGKKIVFLVRPKAELSSAGYGPEAHNMRAYLELAIRIARKWGIPCLNLWDGCYFNPMLPWHYDPSLDAVQNNRTGNYYVDGVHLSAAGYDVSADVIDSWLKTL